MILPEEKVLDSYFVEKFNNINYTLYHKLNLLL